MTYKLLVAALLAATPALAAGPGPMTIAAAVADPARPPADVARDMDRKPAEMLKFAGVKPGMTVVDIMPGGGYFTRLFSDVVGPKGTVVAYMPDEYIQAGRDPAKMTDGLMGLAKIAPNIMPIHDKLLDPAPPAQSDVVWTSQNYHDLHLIPGADMIAFDKLVYTNLKPGGVFVILDHAAAPGSGTSTTKDLHRIDPETVKREVTAAGFVYEGELTVLRNPADDHTKKIFDPALRGHTDQFIYKFRKPKK